jgi:hypothetical protein
VTAAAAAVRWWCSSCNEDLHLENTLWKSPDGDYRCKVGGYPTQGGGQVIYVERVAHRPANDWVHPALRPAEVEAVA